LLAINLCEDRYAFLVAFAALAASGRASLLPQSRAPAVVAELLARYPEACCVAEQVPAEAPERLHLLRPAAGPGDAPCPLLPPEAPVAIGFTSGSTGQPCGHAKRWGGFAAVTAENARLLDALIGGGRADLVATVPPQH